MMPASNLNGLEGLAYVVVIALVVCAAALLTGPLAFVFGKMGGRFRGAALILGIIACVVGALGLLLVVGFLFLSLNQLHFPYEALLFLLPPSASIVLGVAALRLRARPKYL